MAAIIETKVERKHTGVLSPEIKILSPVGICSTGQELYQDEYGKLWCVESVQLESYRTSGTPISDLYEPCTYQGKFLGINAKENLACLPRGWIDDYIEQFPMIAEVKEDNVHWPTIHALRQLFEIPSRRYPGEPAHEYNPARLAKLYAWIGPECLYGISSRICEARYNFLKNMWDDLLFSPFLTGAQATEDLKTDYEFLKPPSGMKVSILRLSGSTPGAIIHSYVDEKYHSMEHAVHQTHIILANQKLQHENNIVNDWRDILKGSVNRGKAEKVPVSITLPGGPIITTAELSPTELAPTLPTEPISTSSISGSITPPTAVNIPFTFIPGGSIVGRYRPTTRRMI